MIQFHDTDRPAALHRHEDLQRFLNTTIEKPAVLDESGFRALSASAQAEYDRSRLRFLSGGIVLDTPAVKQARKLLRQSFAANVGRNSGHVGLMLNGDSTVGKTTAAKSLMRYVFNNYRRQCPEFEALGRIPIAYSEVPAGSTGKMLMKSFAHFLGLPVAPRDSMVDIRNRVVDAMNAAGTQLIVVDELQNLAGRSIGNGESVDVLKNLHNDLAGTFVYAGIDLTSGHILAGPRGQQLAGRFNVVDMTRFKQTNATDRATWKGTIKAFEHDLPLRDHEAGSLVEMHEYLFERTNGSIGSLGRLLTGAAIEAITNDDVKFESLTRELLEEQILDITAEDYYASTKRKAANRPKGKRLLETLVAR